ncbi:MAG: hypothetical protein B7W98_00875 [Parcubacteria group bacterium 20-58-5]|nr:MAG: hypothetical protein B7W98_00875 [Parcubacteria group bacterium 20-58-5]OYV63737.1 MAG: hypothetical protein B7X03_00655 [Parcubacteria group bacterium 21-58-10]HQT83107.1 hypothetical protein [Candidatus Paceibacterota bacterium]
MNKTVLTWGIVGIVVIGGGAVLFSGHDDDMPRHIAPNPAPVSASSTALMQSTGMLFAQSQYASKAHEVFPTLGTDTKKTMGAFGYTTTALGNNTYRITLTNNAEGYQGESVVVGGGQSVYFVELSGRDDTDAEDSGIADDFLVAVDAQGNILK